MDLQENADLVLAAYDWYVKKVKDKTYRPADAEYPVWVSYDEGSTMLLSENTVILQLEVDEELIMPVDINKWGMILNYAYLPLDDADKTRHLRLLADYNISDTQAFMSQFYPEIKREIISSWDRLFDDSIVINNAMKYGTMWELKREWVVDVMR